MHFEEMECLKVEGGIVTPELSCEECISGDVNHISTLVSEDTGYAWTEKSIAYKTNVMQILFMDHLIFITMN